MPERAEIEAVHRELERTHGDPDTNDGVWRHGTWKRRTQNLEVIANVIAALDRVRDARGGDEAARLRAAAKRVLEADMRGVRDLDALNALEDAAGFSQQGQRRSGESDEGGNQ